MSSNMAAHDITFMNSAASLLISCMKGTHTRSTYSRRLNARFGRFILSRLFHNHFEQNDVAEPRPLAGGHQLLSAGAVPLSSRDSHPGGLHRLQSPEASSGSERMSEHLQSMGGGAKREFPPAEAERRRRRRERNKIAAAKCRNKKKEKTETLQQESEKLETVNADLKSQIEELKQQKQQLVYMLNLHRPTCIVRAQNGCTPEDERNLFIQHIKESTLQLQNITSSMSANPSVTSNTFTTATAAAADSTATIDSEVLSLEHVRCSGHL
uniref:BZIP domain-containing protein n=1 Tax=Knipowitschia caucasica TaxID=637954 RepID=A0AAV2K7R1_KNICA